MSVSLYRKYRPQNFASVVGQKSAVEILTHSLERGRVGHAYLFSGSRGCGKTSIARIFAKSLNCLDRQGFEPCGKCRNCLDITSGESLDVIEIDGASNNGVENIRGLKENVTLSPFNSKYKIYIIDEVHMLSQGAFNALLKTLEEPPEHVIFIMATTEPHKVPVTIRSRCQHIPFHSITPDDIFTRLEYVCQCENIAFEAEALREIARQSDGALRDALSLLEQSAASGDVTLQRVESVFGTGSRSSFERWLVELRTNPESAYRGLKAMFDTGASALRVFEEIFTLIRDLWLVSKWKTITDSLSLSEEDRNFLVTESENWKPSELHKLLGILLELLRQARSGIRTEILLGTFVFMLDDEEKEQEQEPPPPVIKKIAPAVETPAPVAVPVHVETDEGLKAELINIASEKNKMICYAMFDTRPYRRGDDVILDFEHRYCFEVMRVDRNAGEIAEIFSVYGDIVLKFREAEYTCVKFETAPIAENFTETEKPRQQRAKDIIGELISTEQDKPSPPPEAKSNSAFGDLMQKLKAIGLRPEMILLKHSESESDDTEQDSDNDNE